MDIIKNKYILGVQSLQIYFKSVKTWEKIDNYTIRFYCDKQYFKLFEFIAGLAALPKHIYIKPGQVFKTKKEFATHIENHKANFTPVGTGRYYFPSDLLPNREKGKGWIKNERVMLIRNDDYFRKESRGYLKKIFIHFISSYEAAFIELKNGKIDFLERTKSDQFFESSNSDQFLSKYVKALIYSGGYGYIGFNMKKIFFEDKRVRQAFTHLVDRERVNNNISYGINVIVSGNQNFFSPAYNNALKPHPYDRQKAIKLLNEAGWIDTDGDGIRDKDGVPFNVELLYPHSEPPPSTILLYEELNSVGIRFKLTRLEWTVFLEHLIDRRFDLCMLGWSNPSIEGDPYQIWHSSQWAKGSNAGGFINKEADQTILKIRRELNRNKRLKLQYRFHEILHEEQPYIFLYSTPSKTIYNKRYRNVKLYRRAPGYNLWEWYVPVKLQTKKERDAEKNTK